jgi:putative aldouronate transport system substrate-binding protein
VLNAKYPWVGIGGLKYGLASNYDTPADVYDYWYSKDFIDDMKLMKSWCDQGFWPKDILAKNASLEADRYNFQQEIAEVGGENASKHINHVVYFDQYAPEVETTFRAYGETNGVVYPAHGTQNGTAVLRSCKHPELAIQVLNYIMMDKEMNQLVQAGIEGVHYELRDGLWYSLAKTEPFPFPDEGLNTWNLRVKEYKMVKPADVGLNEIFARLEAVGAKTKFPNVNIQQGFAEDFSEYEAERAAVIAVIEQYLRPLEAGVVDDVDAAVAEFLEKAEAAGLAKCREGFKAQWLAYCEAYGYK